MKYSIDSTGSLLKLSWNKWPLLWYFLLEVGSIANTQTFNRFGNAFISFPDKQMYVVAHQAICVHRIGLRKGGCPCSSRLFVKPHKNLLHPYIVLFLLKDILFVDTPKHETTYAVLWNSSCDFDVAFASLI